MSRASKISVTSSRLDFPDTSSHKTNEYSNNRGRITRAETRKRRILQVHQSSVRSSYVKTNTNNSANGKSDTDINGSHRDKQKESRIHENFDESRFENDEDNLAHDKKTNNYSCDESDSSSGSSSIIDSSDSETSSDEEQTLPDDRKKFIEELVSKASTNIKKNDMERQGEKEKSAVQNARVKKYVKDFISGIPTQALSFGVAGATTISTGIPWAFPIVAGILNEVLAEKIGMLLRDSTYVVPETKKWLEIQRQLGRALGDIVASCKNADNAQTKKKFSIIINGKKQPATAAEALRATGVYEIFASFSKNLLVRGLPFTWFAAIYIARDWTVHNTFSNYFHPNVSASCGPDSNLDSFCNTSSTENSFVHPQELATAITYLGGMLAGGLTAMTSQLIASCMAGSEEKINFSTEYYVKKVLYLESLRKDIKNYIDDLSPESDGYEENLMSAIELEKLANKELDYAKGKASLWTTYFAELNLATQKKRDATMISPEFGSKRIDMGLSILGKTLSLLTYAGLASRFGMNSDASTDEKTQGLYALPLALIYAGYMWRDEARLVGQIPLDFVKGCIRGCKGAPQEDTVTALSSVTVKKNGASHEEPGHTEEASSSDDDSSSDSDGYSTADNDQSDDGTQSASGSESSVRV